MLVDMGLAGVRGGGSDAPPTLIGLEPGWLGPCGKSPPHTRLSTDHPGWWTVQQPQCQTGAEEGYRAASVEHCREETRPEPERGGHAVARFPPVSEQRPNATRGHRRCPLIRVTVDQLDGAKAEGHRSVPLRLYAAESSFELASRKLMSR